MNRLLQGSLIPVMGPTAATVPYGAFLEVELGEDDSRSRNKSVQVSDAVTSRYPSLRESQE